MGISRECSGPFCFSEKWEVRSSAASEGGGGVWEGVGKEEREVVGTPGTFEELAGLLMVNF